MQRLRAVRSHDSFDLAYVTVAAALAVLLAIQTLNQQWSSDFWVHLATVRAYAAHPLHPLEPFTGVNIRDPLLSPYMFVLGSVTRGLGVDAVGVLAVAGLFNLALWLFALWRFVLALTRNRAAPVFALLFTLLAWGINPWRWSGYFNINSIGFGLPYPSMFASGLALLALASTIHWLKGRGVGHLVVVGLSVPIVLLTHPFTAIWAAVFGAALVLGATNREEAGRDNARRLAILAALVAGGFALALLWPGYSLFKLVRIGGQFDHQHRPLYTHFVFRAFLMLPGIAALWFRARRDLRDPLVLMFAGTLVVFAVGGLTHDWSLGRIFPGLALSVHIALADAVATFITKTDLTRQRRILASAAVAGVLLIGLAGSTSGLIRMVPRGVVPASRASDPRLASIVTPYRPLFHLLGDARVVASPSLKEIVAGVSGHVLVPPVPTFLDDVARRSRDSTAILSPSTAARQRRALLDVDDIAFIVVTPKEAAALRTELKPDANVVATTKNYVVFKVFGSNAT
jgi:hypothetical protein